MAPNSPEAGGYHPERRDLNDILTPEQLAAQQRGVQEGYGDTVSPADQAALDLAQEQQRELAAWLREELL